MRLKHCESTGGIEMSDKKEQEWIKKAAEQIAHSLTDDPQASQWSGEIFWASIHAPKFIGEIIAEHVPSELQAMADALHKIAGLEYSKAATNGFAYEAHKIATEALAKHAPSYSVEAHKLLHSLWTKAVGSTGYDKSEWQALERILTGTRPSYSAEGVERLVEALEEAHKAGEMGGWEDCPAENSCSCCEAWRKARQLKDQALKPFRKEK